MATLYVEIGKPGRVVTKGGQSPTLIHHNDMLKSASLAIDTGAATTTLSLTAANITAGYEVARLSADAACYFAVGASPDPTTSPRRVLFANQTVDVLIGASDEVAVVEV